MSLSSELEDLEVQLKSLPEAGHKALAARDGALFLVDLIIVGAVKRSLSLGHGLIAMVKTKNMTCARAIVRMQIDTVSRLLAYTYVDDPEGMATPGVRAAGAGADPGRKIEKQAAGCLGNRDGTRQKTRV